MEEKLEHVTSAMLVAKQNEFEDLMDVPEEDRLHSNGSVQNAVECKPLCTTIVISW